MSPAPEKSLSEGTDVGGAERYLWANFASGRKRGLFSSHQVNEFPLWNVINGSARYLSTTELYVLSISAPACLSISETHFSTFVLGRFVMVLWTPECQ